ncbi:ATP-binding cassette domain-containing protein [Mesorhizobium sp. M1060]|uniref:ABC transporter ATP-binding protein n=1 Tax=unclassified Mesorhizobium TaxID=325217 RepID=UPI0003CF6CD3|nr:MULTISPECIES: ATP-binding cassette domain-containing protein [unclassified Mesorhizobium]ESW92239.1 sugar ABC transporter ATP-binding protein [Mesorhizobium sp. LSJC269B00]ESX07978.1 sugar ABC transporter ATP-binding protein [Mesorhizobium sp. LSJC265A00]ESX52033.1 sugar ABC transporter ATP-binding protein [Mesorhizobium sp. LSHC426A00]ESX59056.1 sugar ABC transporter ATP-binding protein [Mesorhizobium sp. LSHC424B00]ESX68514.1 sugar ABC transporter ATP-binding protein [Mesorhizobium sp. LS
MSPPSIHLSDVTVRIPVWSAPANRSLKQAALRFTTGGRLLAGDSGRFEVAALDGVSLDLKPGTRLGLSGHNGAGKTTLLRVLAGILKPTSGTAVINGDSAVLITPSMGLSPELTGREFIRLQSLMTGIAPREIERQTESIIEFSELGDFINLPVRTYSSGMQTRLSFSVVTAYPTDIVLLDEGLGTGDASFQKKARERMEHWLNNAAIVVLASHSDALIRSMCSSAVFLEKGRVVREETFG